MFGAEMQKTKGSGVKKLGQMQTLNAEFRDVVLTNSYVIMFTLLRVWSGSDTLLVNLCIFTHRTINQLES
jgi:hypothetical protein